MADDLDNASFRRGGNPLAGLAFDPYAPTVTVQYLPPADGHEQMVEIRASMWDVQAVTTVDTERFDRGHMMAKAIDEVTRRGVRIYDADGNVLAEAWMATLPAPHYLG